MDFDIGDIILFEDKDDSTVFWILYVESVDLINDSLDYTVLDCSSSTVYMGISAGTRDYTKEKPQMSLLGKAQDSGSNFYLGDVNAKLYDLSDAKISEPKHRCHCEYYQVIHFGCKCGGI